MINSERQIEKNKMWKYPSPSPEFKNPNLDWAIDLYLDDKNLTHIIR